MMNINYKWLIQTAPQLSSIEQEKAIWNKIHTEYSKFTFSMTQNPKICKQLIHPSSDYSSFDIPNSPEIKVLIPGCGSEIYLQKTLLGFCPQIGQIYCTDFSKTAIEQAKSNWQQVDGETRLNNHQLVFEEIDSTKIIERKPEWKDKFDYILIVNSVLSGEDKINRQMLAEFYQVLKPGGRLYGFFPTIFWDLEVAYLDKSKAHWLTDGTIDLLHSSWNDKEWKDCQIYYTPLRLNRIFTEIGFKRLSFEIDFNDSASARANQKNLYDIDDPDIYPWEFLVRLEK